MNCNIKTIILAIFIFASNICFASEPDNIDNTESQKSTFVLYYENDLFYHHDGYYTNAVKFRVISKPLNTLTKNGIFPDTFDSVMEKFEKSQNKQFTQYNISAGAGQSIYTPKDTTIRDLQEDDRPYAGYLYSFLALHAKQIQMMDTFEITAGVVGPSALAEYAQNGVHRLRGFETAKGWDHQLHDEPAMTLSWGRNYRLNKQSIWSGLSWDVLPYHTLTVGNVLTQATAGSELRLGWNLPPSFNTSQIHPSSSIGAPTPEDKGGRQSKDWGFYVFAGGEGRAVAHNIFLDGNTWGDSHRVAKEPFVGEVSFGAAVTINSLQIAYRHVYLTEEFKKQKGAQNYGSITLVLPF
jgi:Uncharacterized protein conserved in bacteria